MTPFEKKSAIDEFVRQKVDRAKDLYEKGHLIPAYYMAMLAGMWMHTLHLPNQPPFDSVKEGELYSYCYSGYNASMDARGITREMQLKAAEEEKKRKKEDLKKYNEQLKAEKAALMNPKKETQSFWTKKLW